LSFVFDVSVEKRCWEVTMRKLLWLLALACLPTIALAQNAGPDWAYPVAPPGAPARDANKILKVPGSDKTYNEVSANDAFGPTGSRTSTLRCRPSLPPERSPMCALARSVI
jgi:hypothetical protein